MTREAKSERRRARGEEREAKSERRRARGEEREAKSERRRARGEERGAKSEGRRARGEEREAKSERRRARGEERGAKSEGRRVRGEEREAKSEGRRARGEEREAKSERRRARGEEREAKSEGRRAKWKGKQWPLSARFGTWTFTSLHSRAAQEIYRLSKTFPPEEKYSLTDQIRRASRSVCANIAEAWRKRRYPASFVSKLSDADTEAGETQVWLDFSRDCGYITKEKHADLDDKYDHICAATVQDDGQSRSMVPRVVTSLFALRPSPLALRSSLFALLFLPP